MEENDEYGQETPAPGPRGDTGRICKDQAGKHAIILTGINYLELKSSILAHLIQAKVILTKEETVPPTTVPLDIELWNRKNELLYTRIFQSVNATARDSLGPLDDTYMAATIRKDLAQRYAISRAEERLQTTKKMRYLRLKNSNATTASRLVILSNIAGSRIQALQVRIGGNATKAGLRL
ncbi:hypothetical protein ACJ73_03583 [Blastomyces percursus]|uniref:Uncharacterized protein n=1 Tax=Blastomyces percursus TaxID=1658174 RepID=A0A1J9R947_9EURO|nr:hypothetical protein ACJ73_03583 [Blastomyces percursus]